MTTPRTRVIVSAVVSAVVSLIVTNVLAACAGNTSRAGSDVVTAAVQPILVFDNDARDYTQVYLVSDQRQWYLGRVEHGARRTLRVPGDAILTSPQRLQLAVMVGQPITPWVATEPRAMFTIAQPASSLFSQDWSVAQGQLVSAPIRRGRVVRLY